MTPVPVAKSPSHQDALEVGFGPIPIRGPLRDLT